MAENKQPFPGFVGPSYQSRSTRFNNQRAVNLYIEADESGTAKGSEPAMMVGTPGLRLVTTLDPGPIRQVYVPSNNGNFLYVISGDTVYITSDLVTFTPCLETLLSISGPISIADNGTSIMFVDGVFGYTITIGKTDLTRISSPNFYSACNITFMDGYFILNQVGTAFFFWSDLYDVTFPTLNTAAKAGNSDNVIGLTSNSRQIYLFGNQTTEVWYDSGASGITPFSRNDGKFMQFGCIAPATITKVDNTVLWLGSSQNGGAQVFMLNNDQAGRVSTHPVEYAIQNLGTDLSKSTAYGYQEEGHFFYVLNPTGSETTWVYDVLTAQWHERQSLAIIKLPPTPPGCSDQGAVTPLVVQGTLQTIDHYTDHLPFQYQCGINNLLVIGIQSPATDISNAMDDTWTPCGNYTNDQNQAIYTWYKYSNQEQYITFNLTSEELTTISPICVEVAGVSQDPSCVFVGSVFNSTDPITPIDLTMDNSGPTSIVVCVARPDIAVGYGNFWITPTSSHAFSSGFLSTFLNGVGSGPEQSLLLLGGAEWEIGKSSPVAITAASANDITLPVESAGILQFRTLDVLPYQYNLLVGNNDSDTGFLYGWGNFTNAITGDPVIASPSGELIQTNIGGVYPILAVGMYSALHDYTDPDEFILLLSGDFTSHTINSLQVVGYQVQTGDDLTVVYNSMSDITAIKGTNLTPLTGDTITWLPSCLSGFNIDYS